MVQDRRQPPSIATLTRSILRAFERGDVTRLKVVLNQMIDIAADRAGGYPDDALFTAFAWLIDHDDELFDGAIRQGILRHPDLIVTGVQTLRVLALEGSRRRWREMIVADWLALRKEAAATIDPATAEVMWSYALTLDPYGVGENIPPGGRQVGREYFAREPGSDVWVWYGDLPEDVLSKLREQPARNASDDLWFL